MKYLMLPIEVQSWTDVEGKITPLKFRVEGKQGLIEIEIGRILQVTEQKVAGRSTRYFDCQTSNGRTERRYMIQYDITQCRWYLAKW